MSMIHDMETALTDYLAARDALAAADPAGDLDGLISDLARAGSVLLAATTEATDLGLDADLRHDLVAAVSRYRVAVAAHAVALVTRHDPDIRRTMIEQRQAADEVLDLVTDMAATTAWETK